MSTKQKIIVVQRDDVCSIHGGGIRSGGEHGDNVYVSTGPGSLHHIEGQRKSTIECIRTLRVLCKIMAEFNLAVST